MAEATLGSVGTAEEQPQPEGAHEESAVAERVMVATQWQLMWWRFRKHKLAMASAVIITLFYLVVIFADFCAYSDPHEDRRPQRCCCRRRRSTGSTTAASAPYVYGSRASAIRRPSSAVYVAGPEDKKVYLKLFGRGLRVRTLLGLFPTNRHLLGVERRAARGDALPPRHRPAGARSLVAADGGDADLADHRPRRRGAQPLPGRAARRHLGLCMAARSTP